MISRRKTIFSLLSLIPGTLLLKGCKNNGASVTPERKIVLGTIDTFIQGTTPLPLERLSILREGDKLAAMSLVCTHQTCVVSPIQADIAGGLLCPCHGSKFDSRGQVLNGPAAVDLPWYHLEITSERALVVDLNHQVPADWRLSMSEPAQLKPPSLS